MHRICRSLLVLLLTVQVGFAGEISPADRTFFENKIRPMLVKHCFECHSADAKKLGGKLRLDTVAGMRTGGESGAAVVPGQPEKSLLIQALKYEGLEMPPQKPLPETVVNDFISWVKRGAPDPRSDKPETTTTKEVQTKLWSLQPIQEVSVPDVTDRDWSRNSIDRFVLSRMETVGLTPTDDATPRVLIRRLYFDLIGLPPTLEDVTEFEDAFEREGNTATARLVDDLLSRQQFGERWGRHWLDVARFGESNGNDGLGRNPTFPHAWRYRDYVIAAFNADVPYDRFLTEQIAGDLLPSESPEEHDQHLIATGFLAMAAKPAKAMNSNFDMDVVADQIDVIGRGVMGLSVSCARCHDHKFDPISTKDYYALAGIFTSTETMWGVAANEKLTAPATGLHVLKAAPKVLPPEDFVETVLVLESNTGKPKAIPKPPWPIGTPLAMGVRDRKKPADGKVNIKGDAKKHGAVVPRGFLSAITTTNDLKINTKQSGRLELAKWLTSPNHPLTSRVMVNRIWQHLFGTGLVATPDDFGVYGARPTHPQLLDHLAARFQQHWSIKQMIREMVLSRTYQLSSQATSRQRKLDEENKWLARHNRRRLDAEAIRDSMLAVSGQLNLQPGDGSIIRHRDILVNLAGSLHQPSNHRSVYLCYLRSSPPPELAPFNLPEFISVTGKRDVSTLPGQSLHLFNNPFVIQQATHLAGVVTKETTAPANRVKFAWRRVLGRDPVSEELNAALQLIESTSNSTSEETAWLSLCQALLATSEFRYVD